MSTVAVCSSLNCILLKVWCTDGSRTRLEPAMSLVLPSDGGKISSTGVLSGLRLRSSSSQSLTPSIDELVSPLVTVSILCNCFVDPAASFFLEAPPAVYGVYLVPGFSWDSCHHSILPTSLVLSSSGSPSYRSQTLLLCWSNEAPSFQGNSLSGYFFISQR